jgi:hypothetical protein
MPGVYKKTEKPAQSHQSRLAIVGGSELRNELGRLSSKVVQCGACLQQTEYVDDHAYCQMCGAGLSSLMYCGHEPDLVTGHESYHVRPLVRTVDERQHPRIPCRNVKACVKTERSGGIVVDLVNVGQGGVSFTSFATFPHGTQVLIATHYIEGGQNIYQDGRIIRVQFNPSGMLPSEYTVQFSVHARVSTMSVPAPGGQAYAARPR